MKVALLLLLSSSIAARARPADTALGPSCDLRAAGGADKAAFLAFDHELRAALAAGDVAALALLVRFPLRLNHKDGSKTALLNPAALETRFHEVFTPKLRAAVVRRQPEELMCRDTGVMYGDGELWVEPERAADSERYRVAVVNLDEPSPSAAQRAGRRLAFVCDAADRRAVVEMEGDGGARYRAWDKPRALAKKPDLELVGKAGVDGTGVCARWVWTFHRVDDEIVVSEPGCLPGREPGSVGTLTIVVAGRPARKLTCF